MALADYKPASSDPVVGDSDPFFSNTWDQCQDTLQAALESYHTAAGKHVIDGENYGLMYMRTGTYTGDVNADQNITINDIGDVLYFNLWEAISPVPVIAIASMEAGDAKRLTNEAFTTDYIKSLGTGQVTVTGSGNTNGTDYFYVAIGKKATAPGGNGNSFTPTWLEHQDVIDMLAGATDKIPGDLLDELITRFTAEHSDPAGEHAVDNPYNTAAKIIVSDYTGNGVMPRDISLVLAFSGYDIKKIFYCTDDSDPPLIQTASMPYARYLNATALDSSLDFSLTTGGFSIPAKANYVLYIADDASCIDLSPSSHTLTYTEDPATPWAGYHADANAPTLPGDWYCLQAGNYITVPHHTDFDFDGDFEIHIWIAYYDVGASINNWNVFSKGTTIQSKGIVFRIEPGGAYRNFVVYLDGSQRFATGITLSSSTFTEFLLSRSSGIFTLYKNGVSVGTWANTTVYDSTDNVIWGDPANSGIASQPQTHYDDMYIARGESYFNRLGKKYYYAAFCE